ncbi:uncharacterized protein LOC112177598 [Rosa chinensis]|uniref:uncharacterized protein LOC112177598 n=1 Tax=Rosa chinensis TaxID=74649 RepID=UPI000D093B8B|nr:uncharacterized protein LOC112177598 [Rosa chinensis]
MPRKENVKKGGKKKKVGLMSEVHDILKKVNVNIPLIELIRQMPVYAKFLKDLCTHKRKINNDERFEICEEVSAILQRRIPPKLKDPESFIISCTIGEKVFDRALMDLGSSVNIISFETFRKLDLGPIKATPIFLQLADRSIIRAMGVIEDVLIKVDKFYLPVDLVVLDMDDGAHCDKDIPIILGRPFMATAGIKINIQKGTIKMKVLGEKVLLKRLELIYPPEVVKSVISINLVKGNEAKRDRIFGPLNQVPHHNQEPLVTNSSSPCQVFAISTLDKINVSEYLALSEEQKNQIKTIEEICGLKKKKKKGYLEWNTPGNIKFLTSSCGGSSSTKACVGGGGKKEPP